MFIGYARVSTTTQDYEAQLNTLKEAGCNNQIFTDIISGISQNSQRPMFQQMLKTAKSGDTIVVTRLDRLARSLKELLNIVDTFQKNGLHLKILNLQMDTSTSTGRMMLQLLGIVAEFERELIKERTMTGLILARKNGKIGGRPKALQPSQIQQVKQLYKINTPLTQICQMYNIKRSTAYKYINYITPK